MTDTEKKPAKITTLRAALRKIKTLEHGIDELRQKHTNAYNEAYGLRRANDKLEKELADLRADRENIMRSLSAAEGYMDRVKEQDRNTAVDKHGLPILDALRAMHEGHGREPYRELRRF